MNALPQLLAHGTAVWQACLVLFVVSGVAFAHLRPRLASRRSARAVRARIGPAHATVARLDDGKRVTLTGRLRASGGLARRYEDGSEAAAVSAAFASAAGSTGVNARAGELILQVGDATVALRGPVEVVVGSREALAGQPLSRLSAAIERRVEADRSPQGLPLADAVLALRSVAVGDVVRVSGVLHKEASDDGTSYREAASDWTLTRGADPGAADGLMVAFEGTPLVSGPATPVYALPATAGTLLFALVFGAGGELAMAVGRTELRAARYAAEPPRVESLPAVAFAAVTPLRRDGALEALVGVLDLRRDADPAAIAARAAVHQLRGERAETAALWIAHGDPQRGAEFAEASRLDALAARGWYLVGDFGRAEAASGRVDSPENELDLRFATGVHLLAGELGRAAAAARRLSRVFRDKPTATESLQRWYASRAVMTGCLADALDARRGDATAWRRIHEERRKSIAPACAVLRADLFEGQARIDAISGLPELDKSSYDVPVAWLDLLAAEASPRTAAPPAHLPESASEAEALAIPNGGALDRSIPAVDRRLVELLAPERELAVGARRARMRAAASAAAFAMLAGDIGAARLYAKIRRDDAEGLGDGALRRTAALEAVIAVAEGDLGRAHRAVDGAEDAQAEDARRLITYREKGEARPLLDLLVRRPPPDEDEKQAWQLAASGDGAGLTTWLARPHAQPGTFLRLGTPLLKTGRDALARWVRWGYRMPGGFRPTDEMIHLVNLAAAAEALGEKELAAGLRERAGRFYQAITRRETAVALAVLERI
jgi:hypothetical protein